MNTSHASHEDDMDSLPLDSANTPLPFREKIMFESIYPKTVKPRVEKTEKASIKEIKEKDIMIEKIDKMDKISAHQPSIFLFHHVKLKFPPHDFSYQSQ